MNFYKLCDQLIYRKTEVVYADFKLEINIQKNMEHHIQTFVPPRKRVKDGYKAIMHFFNELHWFQGVRIPGISNGCHNDRRLSFYYQAHKDEYLVNGFEQRIFAEDQHRALAFYREADSNSNCYYRFLCLYKILEMPFKDAKTLGEWIDIQIEQHEDSFVKIIKNKIEGDSTGKYIRKEIRHYMTHAQNMGDRSIDYNDFDDWEHIKEINYLLSYLAKDILTTKLMIPENIDINLSSNVSPNS